MTLGLTFAVLAGLSGVLTLWQWRVARRFPLHRKMARPDFNPPITLLKPLKGLDPETGRCLRSWFEQSYAGPVQMVFGVASADDPVCALVRSLMGAFPCWDAQLVVCPERCGVNEKISTLTQLQSCIRHELVLISDADVAAPPDFLANAVAPMRDWEVGLVHCFYRLANPETMAMRWEAVAINADFWSQVLQSISLKRADFALGAVMLTRRAMLESIGGFATLGDYLADDYQLGNRIRRENGQIILCPIVVECWEPQMNWVAVWRHQLRWARTIRICQPLPFFFSILSNATLWPVLWYAVAPVRSVLLAGLGLILLRIISALNNMRRFTCSEAGVGYVWFIPVKDMLQVGLWLFALFGNRITWRGQSYRVTKQGKLYRRA